MLRRVIDHAIWPLLVALPTLTAIALFDRRVPGGLVTAVVLGAVAAAAWILERVRPERPGHSRPDLPVWMEAAHFLFSFELGYGAAVAMSSVAGGAARRLVPLPHWPSEWPLTLQLALAVLLYEGMSYWQHRLLHATSLWRFHALHHSGARLNMPRAIRFHAVDIGTATFVAYLPLVLLDASERLFTVLGVLLGALGVLQHANVRMRTPSWLDAVVCTPSVHRHHHARRRAVADCNYGNTTMLFDWLFGTYRRPERPEGPEEIGIENDTVPATFLRQITSPFERRRAAHR
jgi:ornithine lipid hydroxylase